MPHRSRSAEIAAAARELVESEGREALTMRRLAERLGMRAPSLYKHVRDKEELEMLVIGSALLSLGEAIAGAADLVAMVRAYRTFGLEHPELYRLMTDRPLRRDLLPEGAEDVQPLVRLTGGRDAARAAWAFAHGMVQLELNGRFPSGADLEAAWAEGVRAFSR